MTELGGWALLEELGRGGMGVVYRARRATDGRMAALKTVSGSASVQIDALRQEIRALAQLRHPSLPEVLDEGTDDHRAWYAMTLVDAPDLATLWSADVPTTSATYTVDLEDTGAPGVPAPRPEGSGPRRDWQRWLPTMAQLAAALAHVHGAGLVHGDLKPGNVLVPSPERPVLVDFGLTLRLRGRDDIHQVAASARSRGTPAYLAPERGSGRPWDLRADLYSLGCMLYELVVGHPPYLGGTRQLLDQHRRSPVPSARQHVADLPPQLDTLITRLLAKDPRHRPTHAAEVARALGLDLPDPSPSFFRARLHGREEPLQQLLSGLAEATAGHVRALAIRGDGGVGKTRLGMAVVRTAAQQRVRCLTAASAPLDAPTGRTRSLAAQLVEAAAAEVRDGDKPHKWFGDDLGWLARQFPVLTSLPVPPATPASSGDDGLSAEVGQRRLVARLRHIATTLATQPLLLFVDDLPWADRATRALVEALASGEGRLLLLATARTDDPVPVGFTSVSLGPLPVEAIEAIAADQLGHPVDGPWRAAIPAAEGSPFLLGEALRALADGVRELDAHELAQRRIRQQTGLAADILRFTSHLGLLATPHWLAEALGTDEASVLDDVRRLERQELVFLAPSGVVTFAHARVGQAARLRWPAHHDRDRLAAIAEHIAPFSPEAPGALGELWYRAGRRDRARPLFLAEADDRLAHYALADAEHALQRAAEVDEGGGTCIEAATAAERLARRVWLPMGEARRARDLLVDRLPGLAALDPALAVDLELALAQAHQVLGDYDPARAAATRAEDTARQLHDTERQALAIAAQAAVDTVTGQVAAAEASFRRGARLVRHGDAAFVLQRGLTLSLWHLQRPDEAVASARQLIAVAARGTPYQQADARYVAGLLDVDVGAFPGATEDARDRFAALGAHRKVALCLGNLAGAACAEGRFADAIAPLRASIEALRSFHDPRSVALTQLNLAYVEEQLGDYRAAQATYDRALPVLERLDDGQVARVLVGLSRCARHLGQSAETGRRLLERAAAAGPAPTDHLLVAVEATCWAAQRGAPDATVRALRQDVEERYGPLRGQSVADAQVAELDETLSALRPSMPGAP